MTRRRRSKRGKRIDARVLFDTSRRGRIGGVPSPSPSPSRRSSPVSFPKNDGFLEHHETWEIVSMDGIRRGSMAYVDATTETIRVPIEAIPSSVKESTAEWIRASPLNVSRHFTRRVRAYADQASRCGTYVEVTQSEHAVLGRVSDAKSFLWTRQVAGNVRVVELGRNAKGEICKISVVLKGPEASDGSLDDLLETTERILFLCIGADRGIKTMYFTPGYKLRLRYNSRDGIASVE